MDEFLKDWAHPLLFEMWVVVSMPNFEDGRPVLRENDIEVIGNCIAGLNRELMQRAYPPNKSVNATTDPSQSAQD